MTVGVIGVGYVGLPLAVAFTGAGHDVVALDNDPDLVAGLRDGRSHIEDVSDDALRDALAHLDATTSFAALEACDAVLICVPTPLTRNREPDLSPLVEAGRSLAAVLRRDQLVVLESTT